jgi:hypothetical protein
MNTIGAPKLPSFAPVNELELPCEGCGRTLKMWTNSLAAVLQRPANEITAEMGSSLTASQGWRGWCPDCPAPANAWLLSERLAADAP